MFKAHVCELTVLEMRRAAPTQVRCLVSCIGYGVSMYCHFCMCMVLYGQVEWDMLCLGMFGMSV